MIKQHKPFSKLSLALWGIVISMGLVLEAVGIKDPNDQWPPLTHVIVAYLPEGLVMGFIAWLRSHFTQAYVNDEI